MHDHNWKAFSHDASAFNYQGKLLQTNWSRLHIGDLEKFPSTAALRERLQHNKTETSAKTVVMAVQDAWRAYHQGEFRTAHDLGKKIGVPGFVVATKAVVMYASYLEPDQQRSQHLLSAAIEQAEQMIALLPNEPNAHYLLALALGRFSQRISILAALAQGFAPRVEHALQRTLKLSPKHADAHTAMGLFNAEIIGKLGVFAAGLSYGVSIDKAKEHFRKAMKLNPVQAIVKMEYARALQLIDKDEYAAEIEELLQQAVKCTPMDAVEWLDVERGKEMRE